VKKARNGLVTNHRIPKKERYAMNENSVVSLRQKDDIDDPLTEFCEPALVGDYTGG